MPICLSSRAALIALLWGSSSFITGCDKQSSPATQPSATQQATNSPPNQSLPELRLQRMDGSELSMSSTRGKPVLVNLWATWCAPCVAEMPTLDALAKRESGKLTVLVVSQDLEGAKVVQPWWQAHHFTTLTPLLDPSLRLIGALSNGQAESTSLPMTILYDKEGREVWRTQKGMDWLGDEARAHLQVAGVK